MLDPYPVFPVFAFLGFVVGLVPFPWHLQSWNAGTCIYMIWASLASLIQFVGAIVWRNQAVEIAPVWCDIATKFTIGAGIGIPAASLCIQRRLYNIATTQKVMITKKDKRRDVVVDLCIGVGIPVIVMALHYIVQGHRFNVLQEIGCVPDTYNTLPAYFLVFMWPIVLGSISFVYGAMTLRAFWIRRLQFSEFISSNSSMTVSRYFRLMLLASLEMACTVPLGIFSIYINTHGLTLAPWVSLANTHYDFSHVELIPSVVWRSNPTFVTAQEMGRWIYPVCCFTFFLLFGFADEARKHYRLAFWAVAKPFGYLPKPKPTASKASSSLPVFIPTYPPPYSPEKSVSDADFKKHEKESSLSTTIIVDDTASMTMRSTFLTLDLSRSPSPTLPPTSPSSSTDDELSPTTPPSAFITHRRMMHGLTIDPPAIVNTKEEADAQEIEVEDDGKHDFVDLPLTPAPPRLPRLSSIDNHRTFAEAARAYLDEVYERESAFSSAPPTPFTPATPERPSSRASVISELSEASESDISLSGSSSDEEDYDDAPSPLTPDTFGQQRRRGRPATPQTPPLSASFPRPPSRPTTRNAAVDRPPVVYFHRPFVPSASAPTASTSSTRQVSPARKDVSDMV